MTISQKRIRRITENYVLYLFLLPCLLYFIIFHYGPMYGIQIAFKDFIASRGITGSPWAGFKHFERFFKSYLFWTLIRNTLAISIYRLAASFPIPIILALMINQHQSVGFKKTVQLVTYAPHFISMVVLVGMINIFFSIRTGLVNMALKGMGFEAISFLSEPGWFRDLFVWSAVWQNAGWSTIIYLASLASIDPQLHEAAIVDGASRIQRIWHIDLPGILPTIMILLILNLGRVMNVGFQKAYLMQNALNLETSEVIATYVYKVGLLNAQFSFSAAVGVFNAVINLVLLLSVNKIAKVAGQSSLW